MSGTKPEAIEATVLGKFRCRELADTVQASILVFRDKLNADTIFVRFKTLVGFRGQFEQDWESDVFWNTEPYRKEQADMELSRRIRLA